MIRRYIKIILPILLIIAIIIFVWWITDPKREQEKQLARENIISQVELKNINLNEYGIRNMIHIDNENYILIAQKVAIADEGIPVTGHYTNNYTLYKYNIKSGIGETSINIDEFFQVAGIDTSKNIIYIATTNLGIPKDSVESPYNMVEINYETMQIQKKLSDRTDYYNCLVSDNGNTWIYMANYSLYVSSYNFENEKLLVESMLPGAATAGYLQPCDIVNNNIIYTQYNGENNNTGIGIINKDGTNPRFIQAQLPIYIKYNSLTNEIYYTTQNEFNKVFRVNIDTMEENVLFEHELGDKSINATYYFSPDMKNVVVVETQFINKVQTMKSYLYEITSKKIIAEYDLENNDIISNVNFTKNKIIFIQDNKLYEWNYKIK